MRRIAARQLDWLTTTVMGDNDSDDRGWMRRILPEAGIDHLGGRIAQQNGGNVGVGHPLQNRNTHSGSHQAFMHSGQFQQNQQTMEYSQRKPQTVQPPPPLHHQSMPNSMHKLHLDAEKANNAQRAKQRQEEAMAKAKKEEKTAVPEAVLVDFNTSPLDFQQSTSTSQLLMNNNATANLLADFGPSKMGDGWAGGTGSIAISAPSLASLTSASSYVSIPQFELPEDWSENSHPSAILGLVRDSRPEKFNEVQKIINREPAPDTGLLNYLPAF